MRTRLGLCLMALILAGGAGVLSAADRLVPVPYATIQSALDAAQAGDSVIVAPGTYYENINFHGKAITLRSTDPNNPAIVAATILDGSGATGDPNVGTIVTFNSGETNASALSGFTLQNGFGQTDYLADATWKQMMQGAKSGGGVFCLNASPTITHNTFRANTAEYGGAGIYCHKYASPRIEDNTFETNDAGVYGGGVFCRLYCAPTITRNTFKANSCGTLGGTIYFADHSHVEVRNNWIESGSCHIAGGGVIYYFVSCSPAIVDNIFINNLDTAIRTVAGTNGNIVNNLFTGQSVATVPVFSMGNDSYDLIANNIVYNNSGSGIWTNLYANPSLQHNDFWQNAEGNYIGHLPDQTGLNGNISADPRVGPVLPDPFWPLELEPNSPCRDSGHNASIPPGTTEDYDGSARITGATVDMGPQEFRARAVPQAYPTIQAAINAAVSGDEIHVSPGLYPENINYLGKHLRIRSLNPLDPTTVEATIIDGGQLESCVRMISGENATSAIAGFRLQNGHGEFGGGVHVGNYAASRVLYNHILNCSAFRYGGGIDNRDHAQALIQYNTIENNYAYRAGGGIHNGPYSFVTILDNLITANQAETEAGGGIYSYNKARAVIARNRIIGNSIILGYGAGVHLWQNADSTIEGNLLANNTCQGSDGRGGGISLFSGYTGIVRVANNLILGNRANMGGGLWVQDPGNYEVANNTIVANRATEDFGGGIGVHWQVTSPFHNNLIANNTGGGFFTMAAEPNLAANNLWNNTGSGNYTGDITDQTGLNGNISADPNLIDAGSWSDGGTPEDPADDIFTPGDYHIRWFSPCRDTGNATIAPATDYVGVCRPQYAAVDIGAYEVAVHDLTGGPAVDLAELVLLSESWLATTPGLPADINQDSLVDLQDFAPLANDWLEP